MSIRKRSIPQDVNWSLSSGEILIILTLAAIATEQGGDATPRLFGDDTTQCRKIAAAKTASAAVGASGNNSDPITAAAPAVSAVK